MSMNENFRDAVHHLRWAGRHFRMGISDTINPRIETVRRRLGREATKPSPGRLEQARIRVRTTANERMIGVRQRLDR